MKTEIAIKNLQKKVPLKASLLTRAAKTTLRRERVTRAALSLVFVTDARMTALNRRYLKRNHSTDVLAFDLSGGPAGQPRTRTQKHIVGEIVISTHTAASNARRFKTSVHRELALYVIHGVLHLLGYDDHARRDVTRIRKKEEELLKHIWQ